jgi:hypothetical protein
MKGFDSAEALRELAQGLGAFSQPQWRIFATPAAEVLADIWSPLEST